MYYILTDFLQYVCLLYIHGHMLQTLHVLYTSRLFGTITYTIYKKPFTTQYVHIQYTRRLSTTFMHAIYTGTFYIHVYVLYTCRLSTTGTYTADMKNVGVVEAGFCVFYQYSILIFFQDLSCYVIVQSIWTTQSEIREKCSKTFAWKSQWMIKS